MSNHYSLQEFSRQLSVAAFGSIARCCMLQSANSLVELHSDLDFIGQHRGMSWGYLNERFGSALQTTATLDAAVSINLILITEFTSSRLQTDLWEGTEITVFSLAWLFGKGRV